MTVTQADTSTGAAAHPAAGRVGTLLRSRPVAAVAAALIVGHLLLRVQIASRGYLAVDDWALVARAAEAESLTAGHLFDMFNNHLMPGGMLLTWLVTHAAGLAYWPYVLLMTAGQAVVAVALYRLLCRLLRPGWAVLVPLCVFLFSPLTLEATAWWAVGVNMLPMQLAMVLALGAQLRYVRTGHPRHLVSLALAVLLGLLFFEKALLVVPLVFLFTACVLARGVVDAVRRYWHAWLLLSLISLGYLGLYLARATSTVREPASAGEVVRFVREMVGSTLVPGLLGGPWRWLDTGDGTPVVSPPEAARWVAWAAFATLVLLTVRHRPAAVRAWALLGLYAGLVVGILAVTRLGSQFSDAAGLVPRYVSDVVVVAALCVGLAVSGRRQPEAPPADDPPADDPPAAPGADRARTALASGLVAALLASSGWTAARFGDDWADKAGRDFLATAEAELAAAPDGTVLFDGEVPTAVITALSAPYHRHSRIFAAAGQRPPFVTAAEHPLMFDATGHLRRVRVADGVPNRPGPAPGCGYRVAGGERVPVPLAGSLMAWRWTVRVAYISSADAPAVLHFGGAPGRFQARRGLNEIFFVLDGGGDTVELTVLDPAVTLCTDEITVGSARPS